MMYSTRFSIIYMLLSVLLSPFYLIFNSSSSYNNQNEFGEFTTKVYTAAQNTYLADMTLGTNEPKECYSINDLQISNTYDYEGYVCIVQGKNLGDKIHVYVNLKNDKYTTYTKVGDKTYNYIDYTESGEPELAKEENVKDNKAYYVKNDVKITNELKVVNNKSVNDYEI